ncbi:MAG: hypothetical protein ABIK28_14435 [Planctomycetota bacterium]
MADKTGGRRPEYGRVLLVAVLLIVILFPLAYSVLARIFAEDRDPGKRFLERPDAKYTQCVKETEYMRYHHWELLRGIREEVVRYGKRGSIGLSRCRECHTSRERFCNQCHNATSLRPDCFGCHYYP